MAKGMDVKLTGNTSELEKSLRKLNAAARLSTKELKEIEKAANVTSGKGYELKAQKIEALKQKLEVAKLKLEELNNLEKKWVEEGAIDNKSKEYRKVQRETMLTKEEISKLEKQIKKTNKEPIINQNTIDKLENAKSKLKNLENALDKIAEKTKIFSAISAGALAYSIAKSNEFEDAMIGVQKTTDITNAEMVEFSNTIINMSKQMPSSATEIAKTFEMGGQLGIRKEELKEFSKTIIDLTNSTNLLSEEGSADLAKFNNIVKFTAKDGAEGYRKWGSAVTALGNNSATTEKDIVSMAMRLASAGKSAGMTSAQILSVAATLSSLGLEAEAGGSAMSKLIVKIQQAVETGENYLDDFAKIAGMSSKNFQKAFKEDAVAAIDAFIKGLKKQQDAGKSVSETLEGMKIKEIRLTDTIRRLMNSGDLLNKTVEIGNKAWKENTALTNEASKKYSSTSSQMQMMKNRIDENAISIGNNLRPKLLQLTEVGKGITEWYMKFDKDTNGAITNILLFTAVLTPAILGIKNVVSAVRTMVTVWKNLNLVMMSNPWTIGLTATLVTAGAAITLFTNSADLAGKRTNDSFKQMGKSMAEYYNEAFNGVSRYSEVIDANVRKDGEYIKTQNEVQRAHTEATNIIRKAQEERRSLTQQEHKILSEHLKTIRENKEKELKLLQDQTNIYYEISKKEIQNFNGSKQELNKLFAERYNTIKEGNEKEEKALREAKEIELGLVVEKYRFKGKLNTEEYNKEYAERKEHYDKLLENLITSNNKEMEEINRIKLNKINASSELNSILDGLRAQENENSNKWMNLEKNQFNLNNDVIKGLGFSKWKDQEDRNSQIDRINAKYLENLNETGKKEVAAYLVQAANVEFYGGQLEEKQKENVDKILRALEKLPPQTREVMKNAMKPMVEEMQKKEPTLFEKASNIATGVLSRLKKAFDIHSPSRETRKIFQFVGEGGVLGLEDTEKELYKKIEEISANALQKFRNLSKVSIDMGLIPRIGEIPKLPGNIENHLPFNKNTNKSIVNAPNITINVQELDEYNMKKALDYIDRRFGGKVYG